MRVPPLRFQFCFGAVLTATTVLVAALTPVVFGRRIGSGIALLFAAVLYSVYRAAELKLANSVVREHHAERLSDLHLATVEALALAIDARHEAGHRTFLNRPACAAAIARALGMANSEVQGVRTACLLRDIGRLAVPEPILSKSGPLTQEEFQKIRTHPQVGAEIIGRVPFPYPVASLIRCHHERWDGNGYPAGLRGEAIPLGARILAVVDYFGALISERPYQRPLSVEASLAALSQESGKALDPTVVQTFLAIYPAIADEVAADRELPAPPQPSSGPGDAGSNSWSVFHDIALAQREIYGLYEIAQAVGGSLGVTDTMKLISSKLSNLIPFSTCALFLRVRQTGALHCAFATGVEADLIGRLSMRDGHGLSGWAARNRRAVVNGRPRMDFDAAGCQELQTSLESALVCPLTFDGHCIGTLTVYHVLGSKYTDDHRRLLERIAEQAAAVIHHSLVFEQTREDSLTDPLTGLPNNRFMVGHLRRELARASRLRSEVSLLVMDLDDFKEINDTFGHHIGDRALQEISTALQSAIRPYDICARYAGDEFIAVLSGCGGAEAERKRVDVEKAIAELQFEPRPGETRQLTISAGTAVYPHDGDCYESLLAKADGRMYRNKSRSKQTIEEVEPLERRTASG